METDALPIALFYRFGVALAIGLLIGLQREYAYDQDVAQGEGELPLFAGVRTFSLLALLGCAGAFTADILAAPSVWMGTMLVAGVLIAVAYALGIRSGQAGMTTEVAAFLTLFIGAFCYWQHVTLAVALGVIVTVLLTLKGQMQRLVDRLTREDVYATLKFAVISAVVLPVLPRTGYGPAPFDVLVPYKIWLMVVFISGISFLGYVLIKAVGARRGVGLTGLLGGLASSTAVTLTFAERSRTTEGLAKPFALAILLAWSVMFARVVVEVAVVNAALLGTVWLPMTAGGLVCLGYCAYLYFSQHPEGQEESGTFKNPFELGPAITFGLIYAVILLVANVAQQYFGNTGVYLSSLLSGVADVDAITLSLAELSRDTSQLDAQTATRGIVLAVASNTVVKGAIVLTTGSAALRRVILPGVVLTLAAALVAAFVF